VSISTQLVDIRQMVKTTEEPKDSYHPQKLNHPQSYQHIFTVKLKAKKIIFYVLTL